MQRINTTNNLFSDGDPGTGTKGTLLVAAWLNAVQEELANVIEGFGETLDAEDDEQLSKLLGSYANRPGDFIFLPYQPDAGQLITRKILLCNGGSVLDGDYPDILTAWGGKIYGNADSSHFYLPNLCGYFPRFWDAGAGIDPDADTRTDRGDGVSGNYVGTTQACQNEEHAHVGSAVNQTTLTTGSVACSVGNATGSSLTGVQGGDEARPKNIYIWGGVFY